MKYLSIAGIGLVLAFSAVTSAGILVGHSGTIVTGSTDFDTDGLPKEGTALEGYVDFAVFNPGAFTYAGYTPTPGEAVYAYQVFVEGTDTLSEFSLHLNGTAHNIGNSSAFGDIAPSNAMLIPDPGVAGGDAQWTFDSPGVDPTESSYLLVFSSPRLPENFLGLTVNGGHQALVDPLPTPGPNSIPEPSTLALVVCGLIAVVCIWRRRR